MITAAREQLAAAGVSDRIEVALADAGYWDRDDIQALMADGIAALVPPDAHTRTEPNPKRRGGLYDHMRRILATPHGRMLYRRRMATIEPIFGHTKHNRRADRFGRRSLPAVQTEWRLITATHNLLKAWTARSAAATA